MLIRSITALTVLALAMPALAQTAPAGAQGNPPQRIRSVTLTGDEKCPAPASEDEVVVCARIAPGEQYRIPKALRNEGPVPVQRQAWGARQDTIDEIAREAGGLPNTCSPVGTGGQTGCTQIMLDRARADRRAGTTSPPR